MEFEKTVWKPRGASAILSEQVGDGIGNDDLLCESNETCIYTPNIGSYQGHGALVEAAVIGTGGTVGNVTLLQYESNGL